MIVVAGEALVDLLPRRDVLVPVIGGSPYNVALGLGRLGAEAAYLGRLSRDGFGRRLEQALRAAGVDLGLTRRTDDPTTLAVVHLDEGRADYRFYLEGTSAAGLTATDLLRLPVEAALHVSLGAIGLGTEPAGSAVRELLARERGRRVVSLDPNVRPGAGTDLAAEARRLRSAVAACDLVRVSDEDLALLHPGRDPAAVAAEWLALGPTMVVITRGERGAVALGARGTVEVPGEPVEVVDTVGAGDAFTSGLLAGLHTRDRLRPDALRALGPGELADTLREAVTVAARACTWAGAHPPES